MDGTVVIKVGGSLLDRPRLPLQLEAFLETLSAPRPVLVPGGGQTADLVRGWHKSFKLGEERSHGLALRALSLNTYLLRAILPGATVVHGRKDLEEAWNQRQLPVLDPAVFLETEEPESSIRLPHLWTAGADTVAAWIAVRLSARELVLLKSAPPPAGKTLPELANEGYVDRIPGEITRRIPVVTVVDLRNP